MTVVAFMLGALLASVCCGIAFYTFVRRASQDRWRRGPVGPDRPWERR